MDLLRIFIIMCHSFLLANTQSSASIIQSVHEAEETIQRLTERTEPSLELLGAQLQRGSAAWFMWAANKPTMHNFNNSKMAKIAEEATRKLVHRFSLNRSQVSTMLPTLDIRSTSLGQSCPVSVEFPCQAGRFRSFSGACNNPQNPQWGAASSRLLRLLPPDYIDGVSIPRRSSDGSFLPSTREVSQKLQTNDNTLTHGYLSSLSSVFGQLVMQDISHIPRTAGYKGRPLRCCHVSLEALHPDCLPIQIPPNDPFLKDTNCQEYVRSASSPRVGCTLGPREQVNQATSYIDASFLYGSNKETIQNLRSFRNGFLKNQFSQGQQLLPPDEIGESCQSSPGSLRCFISGDPRVNEHVGLASLHTIFLREHNRVALELNILNQHWGDEQVFQETRRIVAAELQHVIYNEYLPAILGQNSMDKYMLRPLSSGFSHDYDIDVNTGIANSLASAALYFAQASLPSTIPLLDTDYRNAGELLVAQSGYAPWILYGSGGLEKVIRGMLRTTSMKMAFHGSYYLRTGVDTMDLWAHAIQLGRDHGLASYTIWREYCGLPTVSSFSDLNRFMSNRTAQTFATIYKRVEDIDLLPAALEEFHSNEGGALGPTLSCLIGKQFASLRKGDRYWYEAEMPPSAFTAEQLKEIRKVTFARLLCDNSIGLASVQPNAFMLPDNFLNAPVFCSGQSIPKLNIHNWRTGNPGLVLEPWELRAAVDRARRDLGRVRGKERDSLRSNGVADPLSSAGVASALNRPKAQALRIANTSFVLEFASERVLQLKDSERGGAPPRDLRDLLDVLPTIDVGGSALLASLEEEPCDRQTLPCDHTIKYRSASGWCNNLRYPQYGKAVRAFRRVLPSAYDDGLSSPRQRSLNSKNITLPSARAISTAMHSGDNHRPHTRYSLMLMQYAQLLDHDLTHTPMNRGPSESILNCRSCDASTTVHPECWPIRLPKDDPFFPSINPETGKPLCLPFTRSLPGQLTLGPREQLNQVTAYVDASLVYGSDDCEISRLRLFEKGKLNFTVAVRRQQRELLPRISTHPECKAGSGLCFQAGDARSSEQPGLAALHTVFLREHNRMAEELNNLNPHWTDEKIFQETRRILSAVVQQITYNEFLPRILGWEAVHNWDLMLLSEGYYNGYDSTCDAAVSNTFATAAFRFGHSLLKAFIPRVNAELREQIPYLQLRDTFFNPDALMEPGMIDQVMRGLSEAPIEAFDRFITSEVINHLFERRGQPRSGLDLAALNVQRGRDHGLPPYVAFRDLCNLTKANDFNFLIEIPPASRDQLRRIYSRLEDVDLFPGGLAETPPEGALVGPTFACLIAEQFARLRKCDRFWYETSDPMLRFTNEQLESVRKVSLARIVCDNSDDIITIQRHILDLPDSFLNPRVSCKSLPTFNISLWREQQRCQVDGAGLEVGEARRVSPCVTCTCTNEGARCQSVRVSNCFALAHRWSTEAVLNDTVCKVQCAFSFRALPHIAEVDNQLGFI